MFSTPLVSTTALTGLPTERDRTVSKLTVKEEPPVGRNRSKVWAAIAEECRNESGEWRRINRSYTKAHAQQLASNIRSSHRRSKRLAGFKAGERWESTWAETKSGQFAIWIRHIGDVNE